MALFTFASVVESVKGKADKKFFINGPTTKGPTPLGLSSYFSDWTSVHFFLQFLTLGNGLKKNKYVGEEIIVKF